MSAVIKMALNLALKYTVVLPLVLMLLGCASQAGINERTQTRTVAILGVTLAPGVESGRSQNAMARELEDLVQAGGDYRILPSGDVNQAMSLKAPGSYDAMLKNYAASGQLKSNNLRALQTASLPVQTVLIVRVEKNAVRHSDPKRIALRNNAGQVLSDRERVILSTVREMQMRASMINSTSGRVIWSKAYRATPATESSYVNYSGSSFSGSLAASVANTMSHGLKVPAGPVPPSNLLTLRSLLGEIVRNLP